MGISSRTPSRYQGKLAFLVNALRYLVQKNQRGLDQEAQKGLLKVYEEIGGRCPGAEYSNIRSAFPELIQNLL